MGHTRSAGITSSFVLMHRDEADKLTTQRRELADELAVVRAELALIKAERDDLLRRVKAVNAIWQHVQPPTP